MSTSRLTCEPPSGRGTRMPLGGRDEDGRMEMDPPPNHIAVAIPPPLPLAQKKIIFIYLHLMTGIINKSTNLFNINLMGFLVLAWPQPQLDGNGLLIEKLRRRSRFLFFIFFL